MKSNFVADPGVGAGDGGFALFAGRLTSEKGIATLAAAWEELPGVPLRVAGSGPMADIGWSGDVTPLGQVGRREVQQLIGEATVLIFPSTSYECDPMTILEAFASGTPVIASNLGSMAERVQHGSSGLLFRAGDAADLATQVRYAFSHPEHIAEMRRNARREYEEKYTAERNYPQLIAIYERAMENARRRRAA
ncbi:MAG: glycosyltransferase [Acidobacteriota bacterium]